MNVFEENIHPATPERQVDLLVDGELSEADRRALLLQLEHEPDGWRRCALAFLEAQSWRAELAQIAPPAAKPASAEPVSQAAPAIAGSGPNGRRQNWRQYVATTLRIAASFIIALVVGMGLSGNWSGGLHSPDASVVTTATKEFPLPSPVVTHGAAVVPAADGLEMVTLADGQGGTFLVPAQRRDALDQEMLKNIPDAIPQELQQAFEQSGHRVVQQREIVPVQMKDGRRLVVPVDHIEIHYVGRPSL